MFGKSSFINKIKKKTSAKVGNKPGVTLQKQWIKLNDKIEGNSIDKEDDAEEIEETKKIGHNEESNIIDISAEDVSDNSNKIHIRKIDDN